MLSELDSAELTEWMAFDRIEPFGDPRADLRMGILASTTANFGSRELKEPCKPIDFMPFAKRKIVEVKPTLLLDKEAQSRLIKQAIFGVKE